MVDPGTRHKNCTLSFMGWHNPALDHHPGRKQRNRPTNSSRFQEPVAFEQIVIDIVRYSTLITLNPDVFGDYTCPPGILHHKTLSILQIAHIVYYAIALTTNDMSSVPMASNNEEITTTHESTAGYF